MLEQLHSPRDKAIDAMNKVINNKYQPFIVGANRKASLVQKSNANPDETAIASLESSFSQENDYIQPIMNKLSRTTKTYYTPLQQYQRLHFCSLHMSDTMLKEMIKRGTMKDLPSNLFSKIKHFNCRCFICMIDKA